MLLCASIALAALTLAHASVVDLTAATIDIELKEGRWFIKFYAPWYAFRLAVCCPAPT